MQLKIGELIVTKHGVAIILKHVQTAWGAERYLVLLAGKKQYIWDNQFVKTDEDR